MASKPTVQPRWAQTTGGAPASNITAPTSGQQDTGWTNAEPPPSSVMNWWQWLVYGWVLYLADAVLVATTGSGLDGVKATGDGAGSGGNFIGGASGVGAKGTGGSASKQGGQFQAGSTSAPVVGSVNLVPVSATPTTPLDGDVWVESSGSIKARVSGSVRLLAGAAWAQCAMQIGVSTSIPNNTPTTINYSSVVNDSDGAVTTGASWKFTVPAGKSGRYFVAASVAFSTTLASGTVVLQVNIGGSAYAAATIGKVVLSSARNLVTPDLVSGAGFFLALAGQTIYVTVSQTTGGTIVTAPNDASIQIHKLLD